MANAINAVSNGPGQETYGLTWNPDTGWSISGLGLMTYGFLWLRNDIWSDCNARPVTVWTECACNNNCV